VSERAREMKGERASEREKTLKLTNIGKKKNLEINQHWQKKKP